MSLKTKLKNRTTNEIDLYFCLDRKALEELRAARAADEAKSQDRMTKAKSKKARDLEKTVEAATVGIRIYALPWNQYNELVLAHPPREGKDEVFNGETFFIDAARQTAVEITATGTVPIPDEDWLEFIGGLSDGEMDRLASGVVQVNRDVSTVSIAPLV